MPKRLPEPEPVCGAIHTAMCSWCGESNRVYVNAPTYCSRCSHRADRPMSACDCETCRYATFARQLKVSKN